jgi:hypothetical protein
MSRSFLNSGTLIVIRLVNTTKRVLYAPSPPTIVALNDTYRKNTLKVPVREKSATMLQLLFVQQSNCEVAL